MELPHVPLSHLSDFTKFPQLLETMPDTGGLIGSDELELLLSAMGAYADGCEPCEKLTIEQISASKSTVILLHGLSMGACSALIAPLPMTVKERMLKKLLTMTAVERRPAVTAAVRMVTAATYLTGGRS